MIAAQSIATADVHVAGGHTSIVTGQTAASLHSPRFCIPNIILADELTLNASNCLIKFSVVLFYARIFTQLPYFRSLLWVAGALIWCFFAASQIVAVLGFIPVQLLPSLS